MPSVQRTGMGRNAVQPEQVHGLLQLFLNVP